ncbi:MAG: Asp23/Gls24 family envelope stress response protein [Limnochordales bacterium]|nr:Asp23/Gls24 family envelope stress response protein [Limnochordales bacterium]
MEEISAQLGRIQIANEVIAQIAGAAAMTVYGLVGMAARNVQEGLSELLGREQMSRGVEVRGGSDGVILDLHVIVEYGVKISEVAHNIMDQVRYQVENLVGLPVRQVNVHVEGVRVNSPAQPASAGQRGVR